MEQRTAGARDTARAWLRFVALALPAVIAMALLLATTIFGLMWGLLWAVAVAAGYD